MMVEPSWWHGWVLWLTTYPWAVVFGVPVVAGVLVGAVSGPRGLPFRWGWRPFWLAVCSVGTGAFVMLALMMVPQGGLASFDQALASGFASSLPDGLLQCLALFTSLGNRNWLALLACVLVLGLLLRREWRLAIICAVATGGAGGLTLIVKHALQRARPEHLHGYAVEVGWSFPSGHSAGSMAVYGCICLVLARHLPAAQRRLCLILGAMLISAIGVSRVLLQVHYASDVLAGFSLSLAWLALCLAVAGPGVLTRANPAADTRFGPARENA